MNYAAYVFPAVKGFQAKHEYYISMLPMGIIPKLFQFTGEELPVEIRSQRVLNRGRIPEIRDYILTNPNNYVFSSLTVSVDGAMEFSSVTQEDPFIGHIMIAMNARFLINDGQHRCAAIEEAIQKEPSLAEEHISVVFYHDEGLQRAQQMFSDLNRFAIRTTKSINILYNSREEPSVIAKKVVQNVDVFQGLTELERTTISSRSKALFTLSAICTATEELLRGIELPLDEKISLACRFWTEVASHIPEWNAVKRGEMKSSDVRKDCICSLSITLVAIGTGGCALLTECALANWALKLSALDSIDWRKSNPAWENLVFVNGKVAANRSTQRAMSEYFIKRMTEVEGRENA